MAMLTHPFASYLPSVALYRELLSAFVARPIVVAGYLTISSAQGVKHLHYLLFTSQAAATASTPLTLWLNGGS